MLTLTEQGLTHPDGLRSWTIPWAGVHQAMARGSSLLLEVDPASAPPAAMEPDADLVTFESPRLSSPRVAVATAESVEALRRSVPAAPAANADPAVGRHGAWSLPLVALGLLHVVVSLVGLGIVLGR